MSGEQKTLVMSHGATNLAFHTVAALLQTTVGYQSTTKDKTRPAQVHYQDDSWCDADGYEEEDYEDTHYAAEEDYYDDDGDTWYEDTDYGEED